MCACNIDTKPNECDNPECQQRYVNFLTAAAKSVANTKFKEKPIWRINGDLKSKSFRSLLLDMPLIKAKPRPISIIIDDTIPENHIFLVSENNVTCLIENIGCEEE